MGGGQFVEFRSCSGINSFASSISGCNSTVLKLKSGGPAFPDGKRVPGSRPFPSGGKENYFPELEFPFPPTSECNKGQNKGPLYDLIDRETRSTSRNDRVVRRMGYFIVEMNVGSGTLRHRPTLNLSDFIFCHF